MNDTKRKIIESMYTLISEKGYDKTSTNQICEAVGITKPTLYYHFKNKEDILLQMIQYFEENMIREAGDYTELDSPDKFINYLLEMGYYTITESIEDPSFQKAYADIVIQSGRIPAVKQKLDEITVSYENWLTGFVMQGQNLCVFSKQTSAQFLSKTIIIFIHGLEYEVQYQVEAPLQEAWREFVSMLCQSRS